MQVSPGPVFLYGTSDTTLRFPGVVEQLHRHTGDLSSVRDWARAVHRIVLWGRARSDPRTGLLRHGGEAEAIGAATVGLSRVHYGIESPDTTIWDSADRRDHAIDVQVLWWDTLRSTARLLGHAADEGRKATCHQLASHLARTIRERYPWPEESYLFDSLKDDRPVAQIRPNALRAVSARLLPPELARAIVHRATADDLSTPWGLRTLSSRDPSYHPQAYHGGQVWTIATAWAADASFVVGEREQGVDYLRTIAARYAEEGGFANECYLGDRPEPFNSCYLLGFSVAPFLTVLFDRLWGIHVDVPAGVVRIVPGFPAGWTSATLRGLRVGGGTLDLSWSPGRLRVRWQGSHSIAIDTGGGPRNIPLREDVTLDLVAPPEPS
jgi:glycogen debranching enzyme